MLIRCVSALLALTLLASACSDDDTSSASDATPASTTAPTTDAGATTPPSSENALTDTTTTSSTTTTTAPPPPEPEVRSSAGCGTSTPPGTEDLTLTTTDGLAREYRRHVPASYDSSQPTPLILNFHGYTSNIAAQVGLSRLEPLSDTEGFVVVTPQGVTDRNGETFWSVGILADPDGPDATQFTHELLDQVESDLCIDLDRIFATGMSNGGFMSSHLGCTMPERIAAFASVTGIVHNPDCETIRPMPVLHFHGTDDNIVPFAFIPDLVAQWAADAGCTTDPEVTEISDEVELREFPDCDEGGEVDFYVVEGGGHTWPGTPLSAAFESILGYTTEDIDATALAWEWFQAHPLPPRLGA